MNSDDAVSVFEETALSSANAEKQDPVTAVAKPQLPSPLAEDDDEWEGFYEDDEYEEF